MKKIKFSYKKFVTIVLFSTIISAGAATTAFSVAWFSNRNNVGTSFKGETAGAYFARGDGSEEKPYVINRPVHLYNLAWLQYIGYFKDKECYFIIERDLDMSGWTLPPIGSTTNPFTGHLDGYDQTGKAQGQESHQAIISNLTVSNDSETLMKTRHPSTVTSVSNLDVAGVFGMLGAKGTTYTESNTPNVSNLYFKKLTVNDVSNKTLVGLAAGYVNGLLENVGVAGDSKIEVAKNSQPYDTMLTSNLSNYTTVGYCEDKYKTESVEKNVTLSSSAPTYSDDAGGAGGSEQGFGGSIDMNAMYNDLLAIYETHDSIGIKVPSKKTITYDFDGSSKEEITEYATDGEHGTGNTAHYYLNYDQKNENNEISSSYSFTYDGDKKYMTLYGGKEITSTVNMEITSKNPYKLYYKYISYNGNYLSLAQQSTATGGTRYKIDNKTNKEEATAWIIDSNGNIYTKVSTATGSSMTYYLSTSTNGLSVSTSETAIWSYNEETKTISNSSENVIAYSSDLGWHLETSSYRKITDKNGNYWVINDGTTLSMPNGTAYETQATLWSVDSNGYYSVAINGTKYYLSLLNPSGNTTEDVGLSTSTTYAFKYSSTYFSATYTSTGWWSTTKTYYMTTSGSSLVATESKNWEYVVKATPNQFPLNIDADEKKCDVLYNSTTSSETQTFKTNDTFFPISGENGVPDEKNTGYVISGAHSATDSDPWGDIRVSIFSKSSSLKGSGISADSSTLTTVYTINGNGLQTVSANNFENYTDAKSKFETILNKSSTYIYGLHFMSAQINKNNLITAPYARIKENEYKNYQLPEDSIDFNLQRKGYINFFAGTYYGSETSFFSLHEIERNQDTTIKEIREISEVYKNPNVAPSQSYVYKYSDGTYSVPFKHGVKAGIKYDITTGTELKDNTPTKTKPSGYDNCIFKTSWIGANEYYIYQHQNSAFYFEVPVNAGEYALGSVANNAGAYLCYLDIGANAQRTDVTSFTEIKTVSTYVYSYPKGVSFSFIGDNTSALPTIDAKNNASFTLGSSFSGDITITRTDTGSGDSTVSSINYVTSSDDAHISYKGSSIEVTKNGTADSDVQGSYQGKEVTKSLTKIGYSLFNETVTTTRYEYVTKYDSNDAQISTSKDVYTIDENGNETGGGDWLEGIDDEFAKDSDVINKANLTIVYTKLDGKEVKISLLTNFTALDMDETGHYYHALGGYTIVLDTKLECDVTLVSQSDTSLTIKLKTASDSTEITLTLNNTQTVNKA